MSMKPILLVEDNPDDQLLIERSLRKSNVTNPIVVANDGVEALDYLLGTGNQTGKGPIRPALVLIDVKMPQLNGFDVLHLVRKRPETRHIPVVILTSSDEEQDILRSYDMGANSYIRKPVDFDEFADAIGKLGLYWAVLNEPPPDLQFV